MLSVKMRASLVSTGVHVVWIDYAILVVIGLSSRSKSDPWFLKEALSRHRFAAFLSPVVSLAILPSLHLSIR